jgi:hypothetical protein
VVRKKEEKKTREGDAMGVIPSHPCVVALANQTGARDRRQGELSTRAIPIGAWGGMRLIFKVCFVVVIRPVVLQ